MIQNDENYYFHGSPISKIMVETTWAVEFLKNECKKIYMTVRTIQCCMIFFYPKLF